MSEHRRFREFLVLRLAGELDRDDAVALDAHLAVCASCRDEAESLRALAPPPAEPYTSDGDPDFARWRARFLASTLAPLARGATLRRALAAAAIFVVGVGAGVVATRTRDESPNPVWIVDVGGHERAPFALSSPPPAAPPSGLLAFASRARGK